MSIFHRCHLNSGSLVRRSGGGAEIRHQRLPHPHRESLCPSLFIISFPISIGLACLAGREALVSPLRPLFFEPHLSHPVSAGSAQLFPFNKHQSPETYNGARSAKALYDFAIGKMPNFVHVVSPAPATGKNAMDNAKFLATKPDGSGSGSALHALFFSSGKTVTPMLKALSKAHRDSVVLGVVYPPGKGKTGTYLV